MVAPIQTIGAIATTAAGGAVFVYVIGASIMAIRLWAAHLPVNLALSALPRQYLLIVGVRELVFPAFSAALFFYGTARLITRYQEVHGAGQLRRKHESLSRFLLRAVVPLIGFVAQVPLTLTAIAWTLAFSAVTIYGFRLLHVWRPSEGQSRFPAHRIALVALVAVSFAVLFREFDRPLPLDTAVASTTDNRELFGNYIGMDAGFLHLDVGCSLVSIPRDDLKQVSVSRRSVGSRFFGEPSLVSILVAKLRGRNVGGAQQQDIFVSALDGSNRHRLTRVLGRQFRASLVARC